MPSRLEPWAGTGKNGLSTGCIAMVHIPLAGRHVHWVVGAIQKTGIEYVNDFACPHAPAAEWQPSRILQARRKELQDSHDRHSPSKAARTMMAVLELLKYVVAQVKRPSIELMHCPHNCSGTNPKHTIGVFKLLSTSIRPGLKFKGCLVRPTPIPRARPDTGFGFSGGSDDYVLFRRVRLNLSPDKQPLFLIPRHADNVRLTPENRKGEETRQ